MTYISGIFLLADSSVVSGLSAYNRYSLLHIPLYGILTVLLVLALMPLRDIHVSQRTRVIPDHSGEPKNLGISTFQIYPMDRINPATRWLIAGFIAAGVAIADEFHQSFIPSRDGSITDVLLDIVGISLAIFFIHKLYKNRF